jgi:hyperosmotically inducible periplasmic protein
MQRFRIWTSVCLALVGCGQIAGDAANPAAQKAASSEKGARPHASKRSAGPSGIEVVADIRKRVADENMSISALNVRISAASGTLTLRGPVDTDDEKKRIEEIAKDVAGETTIESLLTVKRR